MSITRLVNKKYKQIKRDYTVFIRDNDDIAD